MKSAILIIGGAELGLHQIKAARQAGFSVLVTDRNSGAPGLALADSAGVIDATNHNELETFLSAHKSRYDIRGVYCGNDFGVRAVEHAKQLLDLPHNSFEAAARCTDKRLMKESFERAGIRSPRGYFAASADARPKLPFPLIVKPVEGSGSRGISVVQNATGWGAALTEAFAHTTTGVLVEEYLDGTHHDINGFFFKNSFYPCGVMDRFFTPLPYCVPTKGYYPSSLTDGQQAECYRLLEEAARALGITEGPVKGDLVKTGNTIYIYEASARFHGDVSTSHLYSLRGEISPFERYFATLFADCATPPGPGGAGVAAWYALPSTKGFKDTTDIPGFVWFVGATRAQTDRMFKETL